MSKNSKHRFTPEQLSAYLDGQLGEAERQELERHLGQCPSCRAILDELSRVDQAVQRAEKVTTPDGYFETFGSSVANRIAARKLAARKAPWLVRWGWLPAAATLAGLALILIRSDLTQRELLQSVRETAPEPPATAVSQPHPETSGKTVGAPAIKESKEIPRDEIGAAEDKKETALIPAETSTGQNLAETLVPEQEFSPISGGAAKDMAVEEAAPTASSKRAVSAERPMALKASAPPAATPMLPAKALPRQVRKRLPMAEQSSSVPAPPGADDSSRPAKPTDSGGLSARPGVDEVEAIMICLPDEQPDCPEPKVEKVIEIRVP